MTPSTSEEDTVVKATTVPIGEYSHDLSYILAVGYINTQFDAWTCHKSRIMRIDESQRHNYTMSKYAYIVAL